MSLISIAVGHGGLGIHSALMQYTVDYLSKLNTQPKGSGETHGLCNKPFASAVKRLYFMESRDADNVELYPRSVVVPLDIDLSTLDASTVCRRIHNADSGHSKPCSQDPTCKSEKTWSYLESSIWSIPEASYDIWSRGLFNAASQKDVISDKLRKSVEGTDSFNGFLSFGSLGGGSGSGIGSYISNMISEQYPKTIHVTAAIAPFTYGENGMQSLNMTLALSHYQEFCDGIILLQNDQQNDVGGQLFGTDCTSFNSFNEVSALNLFHGIRPPSSSCPISGGERFHRSLQYITDGLCSYPSLKLLNLHLMPVELLDGSKQNSKGLQQMVNQLADTLKSDPTLCGGLLNEKVSISAKDFAVQESMGANQTKNNNLSKDQIMLQDFSNYDKTAIKHIDCSNRFQDIRRVPVKSPKCKDIEITDEGISSISSGSEVKTTQNVPFKLIKTVGKKRTNVTKYNVVAGIQVNIGGPLQESMNVVELYQDVLFWKHSTRPIQVSHCPNDVGLFGNTVSQISNSQANLPLLDFTSATSKMLYATNAYIHKYTEYGLERDELQDCIINVQEMMNSYAMLSKY
ncbi:tubulin delta chain isoform X1 [Babesia ovis]|uniref:Tubulin delta chain n=1 Tax=Babesia ovis TaxID=5869 RepID=A0A9W5TCF9_BABOV|nr:tubulin delta chain isoform X1 [Babesia ovis]